MAKITKPQAKKHGEAESLLSLSRTLTDDERDFIHDNWHPGAAHLTAVGGQFFTPRSIASELTVFSCRKGTIIDLAAGIGVLGWHIWRLWPRGENVRIIAVELCPGFVEVGKRVFPEAEWILGDVFDKSLWESLGVVDGMVSNPPFGNVPMANGNDKWLSYRGPAHLRACELALRFSRTGGTFVLPSMDLPFEYSGKQHHEYKDSDRHSTNLKRFLATFPDARLSCVGVDVSSCQGDWKEVSPNVEIADVEIEDGGLYDSGFGFGTPDVPSLL